MLFIKKIDIFILKKFGQLFAASFVCCLFVFMMQFTWKSIDELIGKGLTVDVLAEFFWYMGLALVPQALPLAILLAALMTYGNMGQRLELLSMKAAGIPLLRTMAGVGTVVVALAGLSFYFQNATSPWAQLKLNTLLVSIKTNSPVLEIPEGEFYNGIPNLNVYVARKENKTGMLYNLIIYKTDQGFDRAQIVLADSGKLEMTADKMNLKLQLWSGEQFENLQASGSMVAQTTMPYDRETFDYKLFLISFDSNFNMTDESLLSNRPDSKDMKQIVTAIDSMNTYADSVGRTIRSEVQSRGFARNMAPRGSERARLAARATSIKADWARTFAAMPAELRAQVAGTAQTTAQEMQNQLDWEQYSTLDTDKAIRRYQIAWHQKFVLALSCIVFFFIAAPLGSIIRNGGFGLSAVIAVVFFILYYVMSTSGMKLARQGTIPPWLGMWFSMMVLTPIAVFLTRKANNDSFQFNPSAFKLRLRRLLGLKIKRYVPMKEVIITDPDYAACRRELGRLAADARHYARSRKLWLAPNYVNAFFGNDNDEAVADISRRASALVEELSNSRDFYVVAGLNHFPILYTGAHSRPFKSRRVSRLCGIVLPVGLVLWLRMWRFRLILLRDLRQLVGAAENERKYIDKYLSRQNAAAPQPAQT